MKAFSSFKDPAFISRELIKEKVGEIQRNISNIEEAQLRHSKRFSSKYNKLSHRFYVERKMEGQLKAS